MTFVRTIIQRAKERLLKAPFSAIRSDDWEVVKFERKQKIRALYTMMKVRHTVRHRRRRRVEASSFKNVFQRDTLLERKLKRKRLELNKNRCKKQQPWHYNDAHDDTNRYDHNDIEQPGNSQTAEQHGTTSNHHAHVLRDFRLLQLREQKQCRVRQPPRQRQLPPNEDEPVPKRRRRVYLDSDSE